MAETRETLRVSTGACAPACGPDDTYRVRLYDTTATIPRFNNAGSQATVLILQNLTDREQNCDLHFWDPTGAAILQSPLGALLGARQTFVFLLSDFGLAGRSGSITVAHGAGYGGIAGKAVSIEPATGLSFDSPLVFRPR